MDSKNMTPEQIEAILAENARLTAENAQFTKAKEAEPIIKEKMAAGLTREQAESVVQQQADHDKALAELEASQAKTKKK